jgi:hypothetical protein
MYDEAPEIGVLLSLISFPLSGGHIPSRDRQGPTACLVNEEYDDIPSCVSLTHGGVDVFAFPMPSLDKPKVRAILKDLDHFILANSVFSKELVENFLDPDESDDSHLIPT